LRVLFSFGEKSGGKRETRKKTQNLKKLFFFSLHQHRLQHRRALAPDLRARTHPLCSPRQTHQPRLLGSRGRDGPRAPGESRQTRFGGRRQAPGRAPPRGLREARGTVRVRDCDHAKCEGDGLGEAGEVHGGLLGAGKDREFFIILSLFFSLRISSSSSSSFSSSCSSSSTSSSSSHLSLLLLFSSLFLPLSLTSLRKSPNPKGLLPLLRRDGRVLRLLRLRRARH
jgi:hypothetical protein